MPPLSPANYTQSASRAGATDTCYVRRQSQMTVMRTSSLEHRIEVYRLTVPESAQRDENPW